jgi:hypothetical protein
MRPAQRSKIMQRRQQKEIDKAAASRKALLVPAITALKRVPDGQAMRILSEGGIHSLAAYRLLAKWVRSGAEAVIRATEDPLVPCDGHPQIYVPRDIEDHPYWHVVRPTDPEKLNVLMGHVARQMRAQGMVLSVLKTERDETGIGAYRYQVLLEHRDLPETERFESQLVGENIVERLFTRPRGARDDAPWKEEAL